MTPGIVLISLGIVSIAFVQRGRSHPSSAIYRAFANATLIAHTRWSTARGLA
jgi:hypothetical protein